MRPKTSTRRARTGRYHRAAADLLTRTIVSSLTETGYRLLHSPRFFRHAARQILLVRVILADVVVWHGTPTLLPLPCVFIGIRCSKILAIRLPFRKQGEIRTWQKLYRMRIASSGAPHRYSLLKRQRWHRPCQRSVRSARRNSSWALVFATYVERNAARL